MKRVMLFEKRHIQIENELADKRSSVCASERERKKTVVILSRLNSVCNRKKISQFLFDVAFFEFDIIFKSA